MNVYYSRASVSYMVNGKRAVIFSNNIELIFASRAIFEAICAGAEQCCDYSNREFILKIEF